MSSSEALNISLVMPRHADPSETDALLRQAFEGESGARIDAIRRSMIFGIDDSSQILLTIAGTFLGALAARTVHGRLRQFLLELRLRGLNPSNITVNGVEVAVPERADVFISYSSADLSAVQHIRGLLHSAQIMTWMAPERILGGQNYGPIISRAIESASAMIIFWSQAAHRSPEVRQEILLGWKYKKPYLPVRLDQTELSRDVEYCLVGLQWLDVYDVPEELWWPKLERSVAALLAG